MENTFPTAPARTCRTRTRRCRSWPVTPPSMCRARAAGAGSPSLATLSRPTAGTTIASALYVARFSGCCIARQPRVSRNLVRAILHPFLHRSARCASANWLALPTATTRFVGYRGWWARRKGGTVNDGGVLFDFLFLTRLPCRVPLFPPNCKGAIFCETHYRDALAADQSCAKCGQLIETDGISGA